MATFESGRFVLYEPGTGPDGTDGYVTSWDTWRTLTRVADSVRHQTQDDETGRVWHPGAPYEWEAAQT